MEHITSSQNPKYKAALKLHSSRGRQRQGRILVIGNREVERAMDAGVCVLEIAVHESQRDSDWLKELLAGLNRQRVFVYSLAGELFEKLGYGSREVQVVAICERPETSLEQLDLKHSSFVVVLESLEKPGNLGAIARSADGAGASAILLADTRTDIYHPNAIRSSVSAVFSVPIATGTSAELVGWLNDQDYEIFVVTPESKSSVFDVEFTGRTAFVFGNEAEGLSTIWRSSRHQTLKLPMLGIGDSLNVSVTASVLMYEAQRQLGQSS